MTTINDKSKGALEIEQIGRTFVVREKHSKVEISGVEQHTIMFAGTQGRSPIVQDRFTKWLQSQKVEDAARILNTSVGTIARIRKALGGL